MIDTDKYEGHTPAPWRVSPNSRYKIRADENLPEGVHHWHIAQVMNDRGGKWEDMSKVNAQLIADAPLLLEEVMRLHEGIEKLANSMEISANKGKNRMSWPTRLLWVDSLKELIENTKGRTSEVKRLREAIADIATNMEAADASWKVIE
jgi:hypothetical protein